MRRNPVIEVAGFVGSKAAGATQTALGLINLGDTLA